MFKITILKFLLSFVVPSLLATGEIRRDAEGVVSIPYQSGHSFPLNGQSVIHSPPRRVSIPYQSGHSFPQDERKQGGGGEARCFNPLSIGAFISTNRFSSL